MTGSQFLLTTWQGGGNLGPQLGLARRLVAAGHRVRVLSEPTVEADARAVGCSFTPWPTVPSIAAVERDTAVMKDWTVFGRITTAPGSAARCCSAQPAGSPATSSTRWSGTRPTRCSPTSPSSGR